MDGSWLHITEALICCSTLDKHSDFLNIKLMSWKIADQRKNREKLLCYKHRWNLHLVIVNLCCTAELSIYREHTL